MDATKILEVNTHFNSLINSLHECWFLNEQCPGSYSPSFVKLLKKYHKISWDDDCSMVMNQEYFEAHYDTSKPVPKSMILTNKLHLLLSELTTRDIFGRSHWDSFVFSYNEATKQKTAETYTTYMKLYNELSLKPKKD
jgi:hypothetical protein